jgi:hypothetical protein
MQQQKHWQESNILQNNILTKIGQSPLSKRKKLRKQKIKNSRGLLIQLSEIKVCKVEANEGHRQED